MHLRVNQDDQNLLCANALTRRVEFSSIKIRHRNEFRAPAIFARHELLRDTSSLNAGTSPGIKQRRAAQDLETTNNNNSDVYKNDYVEYSLSPAKMSNQQPSPQTHEYPVNTPKRP